MDIGSPVRALVPTGTASVLRVLVGADASFTIRQLARTAGVSAPLAADIVHRLAAHGLVTTQPAGRALLCRFNKDHLAAPAIRDLVTLRARLLEFLREEIATWPIASVHASLFGSAARGDGDTDSDLDLLVIRPDDLTEQETSTWDEQLYATARRTQAATGNPTSWFEITLAELARAALADEPIVTEWRRDAVSLAGESLASTLRKVA
jgi:predicted nucleotidyltransferase